LISNKVTEDVRGRPRLRSASTRCI